MTTSTHRMYAGDSRDMAFLPDRSVQLIVTSPPYPMIEMWDAVFAAQDGSIAAAIAEKQYMAAFEKMHSVLDAVWCECDRVLSDNGFICTNIGDATRTFDGVFQLFSNHSRIIRTFLSLGYSVLPDILWRKPSNSPTKFMGSGMYPAGAYVTYEHEYILIFRKGGKRVFSNKERALRQESAYFWEERNAWFSDLWDIRGTSQILDRSISSRDRNASFPLEVPYRLVNMYSIKGDTVLDPFAGLGTANLACMLSNRSSIGVDIDPGFVQLALKAMTADPGELNRIIDLRIADHRAFIDQLSEESRQKCYDNPAHGFLVKTRQETALKIDRIGSVTRNGDTVMCTYP